uniref:Uncharacterized protein n=1 Tax=Anguilla anguilla TaxID=7936 RepID=A0A0E9R4B7_ANGAN
MRLPVRPASNKRTQKTLLAPEMCRTQFHNSN